MITFIGLKNRSAGKIRGDQVSSILGGNFYDFGEINSNSKIHKFVIIVRNRINKNLEKQLRNRGHIVGYDILDNPVGDLLFRNKNPDISRYSDDDNFDFYIVNNSKNKEELLRHTNRKIFTIPHHSLNFKNIRSCFGEKVVRAGYVGLPEQNPYNKEIVDFCKSIDIDFVSGDFKERQDCEDFLQTLQLGIIFSSNDKRYSGGAINYKGDTSIAFETIKKYKPNTKLANFQSFGIPTISIDYESFNEFGNGDFILANNVNSLYQSILEISKNDDARKDLSDRSYNNGIKYNILKIKDRYRDIISFYDNVT